MRKHRKLPFTLLFSMIIGILLTISIGLSIWLITDRVIIKPGLAVDKIITQYLDGKEATYKKNTISLPGSEVLGWSQDSEELTYYFKLIKDSNEDDVTDTSYTKVTDKVGPINAGTYLIRVEYLVSPDTDPNDGKDDSVVVEEEVTFKIKKATIDMSEVVFKDVVEGNNKIVTFDTNAHTVEIDSTTIPEEITGITYLCNNVEFTGAINATESPYTVVASFTYDSANYIEVEDMVATLTINPKDISSEDITVVFTNYEDNTFYYDAGNDLEEIASSLTVSYDKYVLTLGREYNVTFTNISKVGNYSEKITGIGNFTGEVTINYSIVKSVLVIEVSEDESIFDTSFGKYFFEYTQGGIDFDQYVTIKNSQGNEVSDATISYQYKLLNASSYTSTGIPVNVDEYWVKITATHSDYEISEKEIRYKINYIDFKKVIVTLDSEKLIYNKIEQKVKFTITYNGDELRTGTDYEVQYSNNINAGTAKLILTGKGNFSNDSREFTYTIYQATPTIVVDPILNKTIFVEGEDVGVKTSGKATFDGVELEGTFGSDMSRVEYKTGGDTSQKVKVNYIFYPKDSQNYANVTKESETEYTMYAVAKNVTSGQYYGTIERALNEASNEQKVFVLPDIYTTTGYYPTIRTTANDKTVKIKSGVTLVLSYAGLDESTLGYKVYGTDGGKEKYEGDSAKDNTSGKAGQAVVAEGMILEVSGTLTIGAFVADRSAVGKHAVLMNKGTINLKSGGVTHAYGYIKGTGTFNALSGSTVYDLMRVYDFSGARYAGGMFYKKFYISGGSTYNNIMPFQSYSMHNISCEANIYKGSTYKVRNQFNISNEIYAKEIILFGTGGMFQLTTDADANLTKGYVKRTIENTTATADINGNNSWNTSNQDATQKEVYEFYSNLTDNSITVNLYIIAVDVEVTTNKQVALPIGMMDITIKSGYRMDITTNSFKFLPGSKVTIEDGAELFVDSGINIIFYEEYYDDFAAYTQAGALIDPASASSFSYYSKHLSLYNSDHTVKDEYKSKLVVNGKFDCNGNFGGLIESTKDTGIVELSSGFATLNRLSSIRFLDIGVSDILKAFSGMDMGGTVYSDKQTVKMHLYNGTTINERASSVAAGEYHGVKVDSNGDTESADDDLFGWRALEVYIYYDMNGGNDDDTPATSGKKDATNGYKVADGDLPTFTTPPEREGFEFTGQWATDPEGNNIVVPYNPQNPGAEYTTLYASTIFYAVWDANEFRITYKNKYYDENDSSNGDNFTINPNCDDGEVYTTYTIEDVIVLARPTVTINGKNLVFGGWFNNELCTEEYRVTTIKESAKDMTLYAYWYPANTTTVDIEYQLDIDPTVGDISDDRTPPKDIAAIVQTTSGKWEVKWKPADLTSYNTSTNVDGYLFNTKINGEIVIWFYDAECTVPYDANFESIQDYLIYDSEEDTTGTLKLYAKVLKKTAVTFDFNEGANNSSVKINEGLYYYIPGETLTLPTLTRNDDVHSSWIISDSNVATVNGDSLTINTFGSVTVKAEFKSYYTIKITNSSGYDASVTIYISSDGGNSYSSQTLTIKNKKNNSWNILEGYKVKVYVKVSSWLGSKDGYLDSTDSSPLLVSGDYEFIVSSDSCITAGSLITLYDGSQKKVEDLTNEDLLLVWNHETGTFDYAPAVFLMHKSETERLHRVITLIFSNGKEIRIVSEHGFFSTDLRKYVQINELNVDEYIGHSFATTNDLDSIETIQLIGYYITEEVTTIYSPITFKHLNCFVDGILTVSNFTDGLVNYFDLDENMKYDEEKMKADIEQYGLFTYDDWKEYATYEEFMAFNGTYVKVAVGKGLTTIEDIIARIKQFLNEDNELYNVLE